MLHIDKDIQPEAKQQSQIPFHDRKDVEKKLKRPEKFE